MKMHRRDALKVGAAGMAGALQLVHAGCGGGSGTGGPGGTGGATGASGSSASPQVALQAAGLLRILVRGLVLFEHKPGTSSLVLHLLNATKLGMPTHEARLIVPKTALDEDATSAVATRVENAGTSREFWVFDLAGKTVSILDDAAPADGGIEPSRPTGEKPTGGDWKSLKWLPNVNELSGGTTLTTDASYFVCNVTLKHGKLQGDQPISRVGNEVVWTVKKPDGTQLTKQAYSDSLLYTRPLNGRTPVVTIDAAKVVMRAGAPGNVVMENAQHPPPATPPPGTPVSAGHVSAYFSLVNAAWNPAFTPDPTTLPPCPTCEGDPVFCPPSWGSF